MTRLLRFAFWAAAAFALVMAMLPSPPDLHTSDKLQHMAAFFVITVLGCLAYPRLSRIKLLAGMVAFGALIELVQLEPILHRDSDWHDWAADIFAVLVALALAAMVQRFRRTRTD